MQMFYRCVVQDGVHVTPAGGAGEGVPRGALSRRVRARDARDEDGASRGPDTGETRPLPRIDTRL